MRIEIKADAFAAAALFKGVKDIRYYLNSLAIETGIFGARLIGCDGPSIAVVNIDDEPRETSLIVIPDTIINGFKPVRGAKYVTVEFDTARDGKAMRTVLIEYAGRTVQALEVDCTYPDWRRIVPVAPATGEVAYYAQHLVARVSKAQKLLGFKGDAPAIAQNGTGVGICNLRDDFFALIGPYRNVPNGAVPGWTAS